MKAASTTLLQQAAAQGLPASELTALEAWLPQGKINQKRLDALAMLQSIREFLATAPPPKQPGYRFAATNAWEKIGIPTVPVPPGAGPEGARLPLASLLTNCVWPVFPCRRNRKPVFTPCWC